MPRYKSTGSGWIKVDENDKPVDQQDAAPVVVKEVQTVAPAVAEAPPTPAEPAKPKSKLKAQAKSKSKSRSRRGR